MRRIHTSLAAALLATLVTPCAPAQLKQLSGVIERDDKTYAFAWDGELVTVTRDGERVSQSTPVARPMPEQFVASYVSLATQASVRWSRAADLVDERGAVLGVLHLDGRLGAWVEPMPVVPARASLDIRVEAPAEALAAQLGLDPAASLLVAGVDADGAAAKAGLQRFDILVALAGQRGVDEKTLRETLAGKRPGDQLQVTVLRRGHELGLTVKLGKVEATGVRPALLTWLTDGYGLGAPRSLDRRGKTLSMYVDALRSDLALPATQAIGAADQARLQALDARLAEIEAALRRLEARATGR